MGLRSCKILFISLTILFTPTLFANWFFNVTEQNIAIDGYDVVAYFDGNPRKGQSHFRSEYKEIVYLFNNKTNKKRFDASPEDYLPQLGGWDLYIMSADKNLDKMAPTRWKPDPEKFRIIEGKLYLFSSGAPFDGYNFWENVQPKARIKTAQNFWQSRIEYGNKYPQKPEGLHRHARMENLDWHFFIGSWKGVNKNRISATEKKYGPEQKSTWDFYYDYDGWSIKDDYKSRDIYTGWIGPAFRAYDPIEEVWNMTFRPINVHEDQIWDMKGRFEENGDLLVWQIGKDINRRQYMSRIRFHITSDDSFEWSSDRTYDGGHSWIEDTTVSSWKREK